MKTLTKNYTPQDVKLAYRVVTEDLFNSLLGDKNDTTIKLGTLGKLIKQEKQQKCGWDQQNYVYYHLKFKPFKKLKEALNEQIVKKYRLK
jgi:hypothetical protein